MGSPTAYVFGEFLDGFYDVSQPDVLIMSWYESVLYFSCVAAVEKQVKYNLLYYYRRGD